MSLRTCVSNSPENMYEFSTAVATILEKITSQKFGNDGVIFIQDTGLKKKDYLYIDRGSFDIVKALADAYETELKADKFEKIKLPTIGSSSGGEGGSTQAPTIKIEKVYTSMEELTKGFSTDNLKEGAFVIINTGNVADEDNAKLFYKGKTQYEFLTDLSGAPGVQGPAGKDGKNGVDGKPGLNGKDGAVGPAGKDGAAGAPGKDGKDGIQGQAGPAGMNGFTVKITKNKTHIQSQYTGERVIQGVYYPKENKTPITVIESAPFANLSRVFISGIPEEVKAVRLNTVVITLADETGATLASMNPSFGRPSGTFPELGTLDPSLGTKYDVRGGQCSFKPTFDTMKACQENIDSYNKIAQGKKAAKVTSLEFDFVHLNERDEIVGNTNIREHFITTLDGNPVDIVALSELKGQDGKSAYDIAKANGVTAAKNEKDYVVELSQVKNTKDNSMYDVWIGTTEEFTPIEATMKDKTLYHVIDASTGIVTIKVKKAGA